MNVSFTHRQRNKIYLLINVLLCLLFLQLQGCSTAPVAGKPIEASEVDPYESINRKVFVFNDKLDTYVASPIAKAYKWVTPKFVQTGVFNFFNNLKDINVVLNDVMQAKFQQSFEDTGRFALNSTVGLLGLFDVAEKVGLEKHEEDFGQTLAVWGVPQGPYLVLPLVGPITARGVPGSVFDAAANPASYAGMPIQLVSILNSRANAEGALKFIDEAALDPYVFTRESFLQWRNSLAKDGNVELDDDILDLEDEFYEEDEIEQTSDKSDTTENSNVATVDKTLTPDSNEVNKQADEKAAGFSVKLTAEETGQVDDVNAPKADGVLVDQAVEVEVQQPELSSNTSVEAVGTVKSEQSKTVKKTKPVRFSVEEALAAEPVE